MAKPHIKLRVEAPSIEASATGMFGPGTAHKGASWHERDVAAWRPRQGSADADTLPELPTLRGRARDIDRNSGVAKSGIQTIVDNVVGTGLRLAARPDYKALKREKAWADEWAATVQSLWQSWAYTTACHAGDTLTFDQLTQQALRSELVNGEALGISMWLPERRDGFSTKIQTIESDRLSNPFAGIDGPTRRGGIELEQHGAPTGYWIRNSHPGDNYLIGLYAAYPQWELVPRRILNGRTQVLHVFDQQRSGQNRGKPILSSVLGQFKQADRYVAAEISAAVANAMVAGIITTTMTQDDIVELFKNDADAYLQQRRDHAVALQAGTLLPLFPGDDIKPFIPARPAAQFGTFMENVLRIIAVALDMPYELLLKDFSKSNYSSARAAMLEAWRSFSRRRDWLGTMWCDPIYANFLEEVVNDGRVDAPGFYENRWAYQRCKWIGPGRGYVDQVKEAMAAGIRLDSMLSTLEDECAEQGRDWEETLEQRASEMQRMKDLGLPVVVSGRATIVPDDASSEAAGVPTPGSTPSNDGTTGGQAQAHTLLTQYVLPPQLADLSRLVASFEALQADVKTALARTEPVPA